MQLFDADHSVNLLPVDGIVNYHGQVFSPHEARYFMAQLQQEIEWRHDEINIYGKSLLTKRKVAWYGDMPYAYTYSNTTKHALPWTKSLLAIKSRVEEKSGFGFNSCLLNLYHDGTEGMAWHSDNETELGQNTIIASVSFGAERDFSFKHKRTGQVISTLLENGSLLIMRGSTQSNWLHSLPKRAKVKNARINLTFRNIVTYPSEIRARIL